MLKRISTEFWPSGILASAACTHGTASQRSPARTRGAAQHAHEIGWVSNDDGIFEAMTVRDISRASGLSRVACADVDGDGLADVVAAARWEALLPIVTGIMTGGGETCGERGEFRDARTQTGPKARDLATTTTRTSSRARARYG